MKPARLIWICYAPLGTPSTGPAVVYDSDMADRYVAIGYRVVGPYLYNGAPA